MSQSNPANPHAPLPSLDDWDNDVRRRYAPPAGESSLSPGKGLDKFRDYEAEVRPCVKEFYRLNHTHQTLDFVKAQRSEYLALDRRRMGVWDALELLNTLVDDSDPDIDLPQIVHCLQTAEAIRSDGHPRWMVLTGLIHDLGKLLCLFGEPQWAVVGDTFPLGCAFSDRIVYSEFFSENPDINVERYQSRLGIYEENCGLDRVYLSWGHDEYLYHVVKDYVPLEAQYMIRFHSCYPIHREGAYDYLLDDRDRTMFGWVRAFNPYDLYTKSSDQSDVKTLEPFYRDLIDEFFPSSIRW